MVHFAKRESLLLLELFFFVWFCFLRIVFFFVVFKLFSFFIFDKERKHTSPVPSLHCCNITAMARIRQPRLSPTLPHLKTHEAKPCFFKKTVVNQILKKRKKILLNPLRLGASNPWGKEKEETILSPLRLSLKCFALLSLFRLLSFDSSGVAIRAKVQDRNNRREKKGKKKSRCSLLPRRAWRGKERKKKLSFFSFPFVPTMAAAPTSASHGELRALDALELPQDLKAKVKRETETKEDLSFCREANALIGVETILKSPSRLLFPRRGGWNDRLFAPDDLENVSSCHPRGLFDPKTPVHKC